MKSDYTGHPRVAGLLQLRDTLHQKINESRFNSEGQRMAAQQEIAALNEEIRKRMLEGR